MRNAQPIILGGPKRLACSQNFFASRRVGLTKLSFTPARSSLTTGIIFKGILRTLWWKY